VPRLLDELRRRYPDVTISLMPAIGDVEGLRAAMADWLVHHTPAL
jgi:DNA-binding transcriptional LysR family regulator